MPTHYKEATVTAGQKKSSQDILSELGRSQYAIDEYSKAGRQDLVTNAQEHMNKLKQQAQQVGVDLTKYNGDFRNQYKDYTGNAGSYDPNQPGMVEKTNNPYTGQINDVISQIISQVNQPQENPYDERVEGVLGQIEQMIAQAQQPVDPYGTPQYEAAQAQADAQAHEAIRQAQESLGASGFGRSTIVSDRAQGIQNDANEYLMTQVVPNIVAQIRAQQQQGIGNQQDLLASLVGQQELGDSRSQTELNNLGGIVDLLAGQQSNFNDRQDTQFEQEVTQEELELRQQESALEQALIRTENAGQVLNEADAALLGVPVGTTSQSARQAAERRAHDLNMLQQRLSTQKSIAAAGRTDSQSNSNVRTLLNIWEMTGKAPAGLEELGIEPGTALAESEKSPQELLAEIKLQAEQDRIKEDAEIESQLPGIQSKYGTDPLTAEAIYFVLKNPTKEAAIADIQRQANILKQEGINVDKLFEAVNSQWPEPKKEKTTNSGGLTKEQEEALRSISQLNLP